MAKEKHIHTRIAQHIKDKYPWVLFMSDPSGLRVPMGVRMQIKAQRSIHTIPDMIILEPRGGFYGLIIEVKRSEDEVYKKDGELRKHDRIEAQERSLLFLRAKGYKTSFGLGYEHTINVIDKYMAMPESLDMIDELKREDINPEI